ncbi:hypothetical protein C8Q72DRAFT_799343 [Fomitopsis betulina]|nr:hypothetical protein C8Q72DRAFT_799343 [Fomitopsis betulina]
MAHVMTDFTQREHETYDGDITILSSDSVEFKVHRSKLHTHSEIFPGDELGSINETVCLSEDAATLSLLFLYMSEQPRPDLRLIDFEQVSKLAEAAEKYRVFPAMEVCKTFMWSSASDWPTYVLHHAVRHWHEEQYNEILPKTFAAPRATYCQASALSGSLVGLYRDAWSKALLDARNPPPPGGILHKGGASECDFWHLFAVATIADIGSEPDALVRIPAILEKNCEKLQGCRVCKLRVQEWRRRVQQSITGLPRFRI